MPRTAIALLGIALMIVALLVGVTAACQTAPSPLPTDAEIRQILTDRIDKYKQSVGIAVGIISPGGRRIVTYGSFDQNDPRPVTGDTLFEIGSVTKLFTSLLLADMVKKGEVTLNDPLSKFLPPSVKVPEHNGRAITLVDLSTHTSGLPREPGNLQPVSTADWEAGYSYDKLYEFLSSYKLTREPGSRFEYSNLGGSLLGIALANRAGTDYPTLLEQRILVPLALNSTAIILSPELDRRFAAGHNFRLYRAPAENLKIFAGAGAIRSTANDLLTFLAAFLDYNQTPLAPAMASMFDVSRPMAPPVVRVLAGGQQIHLGWISEPVKGATINWHNGATFGFQSFVGFDPKARTGVVVLSNTHYTGVEDIGMHILNPKVDLKSAKELKPAKQPTEVSVDGAILDRYAGTYNATKEDFYIVTNVDGHLKMDGPPDPIDFYFPESNVTFFSKQFDGEITFKLDAKGSPTEFTWSNSTGQSKRYRKIH